jgi:hypothetical protein
VNPTRRLLVPASAGLVALALASTLASTPALAIKPGSGTSLGSARIFMVNPIQSTGDQSLVDGKDGKEAAMPAEAYTTAPLRNLDGSGRLSGRWASVRTSTGTPAYSSTNTFDYTRDQDQFEQVMGYFWVNEAQEYLQSLGFGSTLRPILKRPYDVRIGQYGVDNSYMTDKGDYIRLGKGGVDDAEDAEVIMHEYAHAIHHDQVPGYGTTIDAGAIGESFGDYFAVSAGLAAADRYGWPVAAEEACPMDWDAASYTAAPHCIRRFDLDLTLADRRNQVHYDGQIWSQALWEIRLGYVAAGKGTRAWDTTMIDAQFDVAPDTTFEQAARAIHDRAVARGAATARLIRDRFAARGIELAG